MKVMKQLVVINVKMCQTRNTTSFCVVSWGCCQFSEFRESGHNKHNGRPTQTCGCSSRHWTGRQSIFWCRFLADDVRKQANRLIVNVSSSRECEEWTLKGGLLIAGFWNCVKKRPRSVRWRHGYHHLILFGLQLLLPTRFNVCAVEQGRWRRQNCAR